MISGRHIQRRRPVKKKKLRVRCYEICKHWIEVGLNSRVYAVIITIVTIYALFAPDIAVVSFTREADPILEGTMSVVFFVFILEVLLYIWVKEDYFPPVGILSSNERASVGIFARGKRFAFLELFSVGSFYFWLDVLAAGSLIFEVRRRYRPCMKRGIP